MSITPSDLKAYSTFEVVKNRPDQQLKMDILEAETYVQKKITNRLDEYVSLPQKLRLALLKVAQFFALVNSDESIVKGYKSEKIGDYSYTLGDGTNMTMPDVSDLLSEYIDKDSPNEGNMFFRMRAL